MRLPWEGERCSGGVRQALAESSSPLGNTNSPIRTLSRLPSSTPLPSHRPQGNLMDNKVLRLHINALHLLASFYLFFWFSGEIFYIWLAINKHAEWFLLTSTWCASEGDVLNVVQTHRRAKSTRFPSVYRFVLSPRSDLLSLSFVCFIFCIFQCLVSFLVCFLTLWETNNLIFSPIGLYKQNWPPILSVSHTFQLI